MDTEMYQEQILDHYKHPLHKQSMNSPTYTSHEVNPLCGDEITIYIEEKTTGGPCQLTFNGQGCAISQAAASLLLDSLQSKKITEIQILTKQDLYVLLGIPISPGREKCATLILKAIHNALATTSKTSSRKEGLSCHSAH